MKKVLRNYRFNFVLDTDLLNKLSDESKKHKITISVLIDNIWINCKDMVERWHFTTDEWYDEDFNENDLHMTEKIRITIELLAKILFFSRNFAISFT